jgi:hypothetical protein
VSDRLKRVLQMVMCLAGLGLLLTETFDETA